MIRKGVVLATILLGSVLLAAAPASASHEGRCVQDQTGVIHDTCNAATCPAFEGPFQCGVDEPQVEPCKEGVGVVVNGEEVCVETPEVGLCDGGVGVTVDDKEFCVVPPAVGPCPPGFVGVVVDDREICLELEDTPCTFPWTLINDCE